MILFGQGRDQNDALLLFPLDLSKEELLCLLGLIGLTDQKLEEFLLLVKFYFLQLG